MTFAEAVKLAFMNYANFNGRARRSEYWYFVLFQFIVSAVLTAIAYPLGGLFSLAVLLPGLGAACRRLHDIGRSGLWLFVSLIPLVGGILLIVWLCEDSQPGANQYGASPKYPQGGYAGGRGYTSPGYSPPALGVRCLSGPMQGQVFPIRGGSLTFGREPDCDIRFPNGTPGISARHCAVTAMGGEATLTDLGSSYGTFFANGALLQPRYPERAAVGTRFYLGSGANLFEIVTI